MYREKMFDGSNSKSVRIEASAWMKAMEELTYDISDISRDRQEQAQRLIEDAQTALQACASKDLRFTDPLVANAKRTVTSVLEFLSDRSELVDCVFFIALSTGSLDSLLDRAEELEIGKLPKRQRQRFRGSMESAIDSLDSKLKKMEEDLDDSDAREQGRLGDA